MDCSPPGPSVHDILQVRILEWVDMPSSRASSPPRDPICVSYVSLHFWIGGQVFFTTSTTWEALKKGVGEFSGGPVVKTLLPSQELEVQSLVRELRSDCCAVQSKKKKKFKKIGRGE